MSKETTFDHPPRGHIALLAYDDSTDKFLALTVDPSKRLEITIPLEEALGARAYHYDGSNWRRSNLLWGYNERLLEVVEDTNVAGGTVNLDMSAVASGYVWYVTSVCYIHAGASCTIMAVQITDGTDTVDIASQDSPTSGTRYFAGREYVLCAGDILRLRAWGTTAGDNLYLRINGYKMKINM